MTTYLRDYQIEARNAIIEALRTNHSTLLVLPTGCVSGGTVVCVNRAGAGRTRTIEKAYAQQWDSHVDDSIPSSIRCHVGDRIGKHSIRGIAYSGKRRTKTLLLENGKTLRATEDHEILTENGFIGIGELTGHSQVICEGRPERIQEPKKYYLYKQGMRFHGYPSGTISYRSGSERKGEGRLYRVLQHRIVVEAAMNGISVERLVELCRRDHEAASSLTFLDPTVYAVHHKNGNQLDNRIENLEVLTHHEHQQLHGSTTHLRNLPGFEVVSSLVSSVSEGILETTYDVVCDDPHRNFVANGIVVHNSGKTEVLLDVIDTWPDKDCDILWLAHLTELISQPFDRWHSKTGHYGEMIQGDYRRKIGSARVNFASKDSLYPERLKKEFPDPDKMGLIICDEAHHASSSAASYTHIFEYFHKAKLVGCTATPDRTDEIALGTTFDSVAYDYPLLDPSGGPSAIGDGWLVPINQQYVVVEDIDFSGVGSRGGDFIDSQLQKMLMNGKAVEKIVAGTMRYCGDRTTLCFASGIEQAIQQAVIFNAELENSARAIASRVPSDKNYDFVVLSSDRERRQRMFKMYKERKFQFLCNVGIVTEGTDIPSASCVSQGRPTKSRSLYTQMSGRVLRVLPNLIEGRYENGDYWRIDDPDERKRLIAESDKPDALVLDFVGNSQHKLIISMPDILGGKYPDDVVELAKSRLTGNKQDVKEALDEAEQEYAELERRKLVKAIVNSTSRAVSPFTVMDVIPTREPGWHKGRKPSDKMKAALGRFRVPTGDVDKMSFHQARMMLDKLVTSARNGDSSYKQRQILLKHGFDPNVKFSQASDTITRIADSGWKLRGNWDGKVRKPIETSKPRYQEMPF